MSTHIEELNPGLKGLGTYEYGWADSDTAGATARRGLNEDVVRDISARKNEPEWMLELRAEVACACSARSRCPAGAATSPASTSRTSSTS